MTTSTHGPNGLSWTALGRRMGYTSEHAQREEILGAIAWMNWVETPARPPYLDRPAVRAVVMAVAHHRRGQLRRVGNAELTGYRQLIGLEYTRGTRDYVLDLGTDSEVIAGDGRAFVLDIGDEAIYVLAQFSDPLQRCDDTAPSDLCGLIDSAPLR